MGKNLKKIEETQKNLLLNYDYVFKYIFQVKDLSDYEIIISFMTYQKTSSFSNVLFLNISFLVEKYKLNENEFIDYVSRFLNKDYLKIFIKENKAKFNLFLDILDEDTKDEINEKKEKLYKKIMKWINKKDRGNIISIDEILRMINKNRNENLGEDKFLEELYLYRASYIAWKNLNNEGKEKYYADLYSMFSSEKFIKDFKNYSKANKEIKEDSNEINIPALGIKIDLEDEENAKKFEELDFIATEITKKALKKILDEYELKESINDKLLKFMKSEKLNIDSLKIIYKEIENLDKVDIHSFIVFSEYCLDLLNNEEDLKINKEKHKNLKNKIENQLVGKKIDFLDEFMEKIIIFIENKLYQGKFSEEEELRIKILVCKIFYLDIKTIEYILNELEKIFKEIVELFLKNINNFSTQEKLSIEN